MDFRHARMETQKRKEQSREESVPQSLINNKEKEEENYRRNCSHQVKMLKWSQRSNKEYVESTATRRCFEKKALHEQQKCSQ
jgi:hypothetical protein